MFNLLIEPCFPVRRQDGQRNHLRLCDITADYQTNPVVDFELPRSDFQGSAYQLAIALLQTAFPPKNDEAWIENFVQPPAPETLQDALAPYIPAFSLWVSEGPAFMQDLEPLESEPNDLQALLIDGPNDSSLKQNTDHFLKRDTLNQLGPFAASMALFCMQTHAPSGGQGHRTGLRGGGPLTSLPMGNTLWESLWLNVFTHAQFCGNREDELRWSAKPKPEDIFPWLTPTVDSKPKTAGVFHGQVHPLQVYWAMPRRIRLEPPSRELKSCSLEGEAVPFVFTHFKTKNYGNNYSGPWKHPLTPHYFKGTGAKREEFPHHGQPGFFGYQHWLGFVVESGDEKSGNLPAQTVRHYLDSRKGDLERIAKRRAAQTGKHQVVQSQMWVFGYDMDNMKVRGWVDAKLPLIYPGTSQPVSKNDLNTFENAVQSMIDSAKDVASSTRKAFLDATAGRAGKARGDTSFVTARFWEATSDAFYQNLQTLADMPADATHRESWLKKLHQTALELFDELTAIRPIDCESIDPKAWAKARTDLLKFTHPNGKKLRKLIGLDDGSKPSEGDKT